MTVAECEPQKKHTNIHILQHSAESLQYAVHDTKWIPLSAKLVALGQNARGQGIIEIFSVEKEGLKSVNKTEKQSGFKCGTFGHASLQTRWLATGDYEGKLSLWDLERLNTPIYSVQAHEKMIHQIDGAGGYGIQSGPPEIVTSSQDGTVKVWDTRQKDKPVCDIQSNSQNQRECWSVSFGNSFNNEERVVACGYDNGDLKLIDLKMLKPVFQTHLPNGICSLEFDRRDIPMNKLVVGGLESEMQIFDMRRSDGKDGFVSLRYQAKNSETIWQCRHLPQNRDVYLTSSGAGNLTLYQYHYPESRKPLTADSDNKPVEAGSLTLLSSCTLTDQPITSFEWHKEKKGLCVMSGVDQTIRVSMVCGLQAAGY